MGKANEVVSPRRVLMNYINSKYLDTVGEEDNVAYL